MQVPHLDINQELHLHPKVCTLCERSTDTVRVQLLYSVTLKTIIICSDKCYEAWKKMIQAMQASKTQQR